MIRKNETVRGEESKRSGQVRNICSTYGDERKCRGDGDLGIGGW
jgi:hypothetical protein